jgi:hypothetical protein
VLLAGPVVLAFLSGGYFDRARAGAGIVAWLLVGVVALCALRPLPRGRAPRLALLGLLGLAAWTTASLAWAPQAGPAYHDGQRVFLYGGALLAATALLRGRPVLRALELSVAGGALVVVGYGLSERLLPGLVTLAHSHSAFGRLEQPLTYWNGMGAIAALGVVLCVRICGDATRSAATRAAAAAAAVPLGLGLYVTFSRGALFACATGLVVLIVARPDRARWQGGAIALAAAVAGALVAVPFAGVSHLAGSHGTRVTEGLAALVIVAAVALAAATLALRARLSAEPIALPRGASWIAAALVVGGFALFLAVGSHESQGRGTVVRGADRLTSLKSNRYAYWRVTGRMFLHAPVQGEGASSFATAWLRHRPFAEGARDAHSLYIETAGELGLVGLALLACWLAAVAWAARDALRLAPGLAAGPLAGVALWAAHAAVDWDWEMPAVTLPALLLAGALLGLADLRAPARRAG